MSKELVLFNSGAMDEANILANGLSVASFETESMEGKAKAYNAANGSAVTVANIIDKEPDKVLELENFVLVPTVAVDEDTGEKIPLVRSVLLCKGVNVSASSIGILNGLRELVATFGDPSSWTAPIPIKLSQSRTRRGNVVFNINIAI